MGMEMMELDFVFPPKLFLFVHTLIHDGRPFSDTVLHERKAKHLALG
jgi:hypothetical protein